MIEIKLKSDNSTVATYAYDYQSRRITKTVGATETNFVYDDWNPIAKFSGTTLSKSYTWGMDLSGSMQGAGGVGGLLSVNDGSATYYPIYDGNGNVSEYVDATGAVVAHYEYDAFGQVVASGTKADEFTHQFSTKQLDSESGLHYYGYRYYDSSNGRWLSRDPLGEMAGANIVAFVSNNAINSYDKLGLSQGFSWSSGKVEKAVSLNAGIWAGHMRHSLDVTIAGTGTDSCENCSGGGQKKQTKFELQVTGSANINIVFGIGKTFNFRYFGATVILGPQVNLNGSIEGQFSATYSRCDSKWHVSGTEVNISFGGRLAGGGYAALRIGRWKSFEASASIGGNVRYASPIGFECDSGGACTAQALGGDLSLSGSIDVSAGRWGFTKNLGQSNVKIDGFDLPSFNLPSMN